MNIHVFNKIPHGSIPYRDNENRLHYIDFKHNRAILTDETALEKFNALREEQIKKGSERTLFTFDEWQTLVRPESQWIGFEDGSSVTRDEVIAGWEYAKENGWTYSQNMVAVAKNTRAGSVTQGVKTSTDAPVSKKSNKEK